MPSAQEAEQRRSPHAPRSPDVEAKILRLRQDEGLTLAQLGTRFGMSQDGIRRLIARLTSRVEQGRSTRECR